MYRAPEVKKALLDAQRKWLAFFDSENNLNTQVLIAAERGTLQNVIFSEKHMETVHQKDASKLLKNPVNYKSDALGALFFSKND